MDAVIECKNLTHYYGKRLIYEDLSFDVPKGRILGLLGKNGTGKTTTINLLSGYLKPRSGQCLVFGEDVQAMPPLLRQRIGLLIEGHVQYTFMNIEQIERFYAQFYPRWRREAYYELMRRLQVAPGQRISRMSCGQRSQVALGLILAQDPDLLVLDDFSLGLDPGYRRLFVDYLSDYARSGDKTVFLTSHIIQDMERLRAHLAAIIRARPARHAASLYLHRARRLRVDGNRPGPASPHHLARPGGGIHFPATGGTGPAPHRPASALPAAGLRAGGQPGGCLHRTDGEVLRGKGKGERRKEKGEREKGKVKRGKNKSKANGLVALSVGQRPTNRGERREVRVRSKKSSAPICEICGKQNPCHPCTETSRTFAQFASFAFPPI